MWGLQLADGGRVTVGARLESARAGVHTSPDHGRGVIPAELSSRVDPAMYSLLAPNAAVAKVRGLLRVLAGTRFLAPIPEWR
jgi:hypothetical protein